jgi:hypothetical protein
MNVLYGIRSLIRFGKARAPLAHSVLYPRRYNMTLYLNRFRGEPAIARFDWPFTPSHSSSPSIATDVGSVLHVVLPTLQPGHG